MMRMILNYFNLMTGKKSLVVFFCLLSLIIGCSDFYRFDSAAPVYKKKQATNPYKQKVSVPKKEDIESIAISDESFEPELTPIEPEIKEEKLLRPSSDTSNNKRQNRELELENQNLSPAILALVTEADRSSRAGDLDSAVVTLERALRIESRNPLLTYKLAKMRLQQGKPGLAENLAKKSALLSGKNKVLKKRAWLLISEARRLQNNNYGAEEAELKANNI